MQEHGSNSHGPQPLINWGTLLLLRMVVVDIIVELHDNLRDISCSLCRRIPWRRLLCDHLQKQNEEV